MDVTIPRKHLLELVTAALVAADGKSPMPILKHVELDAVASSLRVRSTNFLLTYDGARDATVKAPGSVAIHGRTLAGVLKSLPDGDIRIQVAKNFTATLTSSVSKRKASITAMTADDFPSWPTVADANAVDLPAATLHDLWRLTSYAQSTDDTRPHLAATLFVVERNLLRTVTTDGHRLCLAEAPLSEPARVTSSVLVPARAIAALMAHVPATGAVTFFCELAKNLASFRVPGGDTWTTKLIDCAFPSYEQVVPSHHSSEITCSRVAMLDAIQSLQVVAADKTHGVKLTPQGDHLAVASENPEIGSMTDEVPCTIGGDLRPAPWGFNGQYPAQTLAALQGDSIVFEVSGELDPVVIRDPSAGTRSCNVIMPMRI